MSNDRLSNELVRISRTLSQPNFKALCQNLSGGTEENYKKPRSRQLDSKLILEHQTYKQSRSANHLATMFGENMTTQNSTQCYEHKRNI
jgi:hypothetical protein